MSVNKLRFLSYVDVSYGVHFLDFTTRSELEDDVVQEMEDFLVDNGNRRPPEGSRPTNLWGLWMSWGCLELQKGHFSWYFMVFHGEFAGKHAGSVAIHVI